jgi:hypothetical protein
MVLVVVCTKKIGTVKNTDSLNLLSAFESSGDKEEE